MFDKVFIDLSQALFQVAVELNDKKKNNEDGASNRPYLHFQPHA